MTRAAGKGNATRDWRGTRAEKTDSGVQFINPAVLGDLFILRVAESRQILNGDSRKISKYMCTFF